MRSGFALAFVLVAGPLAAQDQPVASATAPAQGPAAQVSRGTAEEVAEAARLSLKAPGTLAPCKAPEGDEIVVCGQDPNALRVKSDTDLGFNTSDGVPRAPDVFGIKPGGVVVARGCFVPPCPRKMPPIIDLKAIPEAPPGSDAARFKDYAGEPPKAPSVPAAKPSAAPATAP